MPNVVTLDKTLRHPEVIPRRNATFDKEKNNSFKIYLTQPARDGLANKQLIELLARHLKVIKYQIKIIQGEKSRNKVVEIDSRFAAVKK